MSTEVEMDNALPNEPETENDDATVATEATDAATGNVHRLQLDDREIILIGTAHVSKASVDEVREIIAAEKPDTVCIELCQSRYDTIMDGNKWKNTDIISIIKQGKALMLLINLTLSSYQKRLAKQFGISPGQEMIQGIHSANELGATICLADRDIQTTLRRLWSGVGLWGKTKLIFQLILSVLLDEDISEAEMEKMKNEDMLTATLNELAVSFPQFKSILIDERDQYLAQKIKEAPGRKVVAVLGAGHVPGIKKAIHEDHDLSQLTYLKPPSKATKIIGWSIPVLIIALIAATFTVDSAAGIDQIISYVLWVGSLSAIGTIIAFGHPLSVLTAFVAAPIGALSPVLATGWFVGLAEAFIKKPQVEDFERISEDIHTVKGFWRNKVTHILLVVVFANLGCAVGNIIGGAEVIRQFLRAFW